MSAVRSKVRLYDLAKDLKIDTKRLIEEVRREGVDVSVPSNSISKDFAKRIRDRYSAKDRSQGKRANKFPGDSLTRHLPIVSAVDSSIRKPQITVVQLKGPLPNNNKGALSQDVVTGETKVPVQKESSSKTTVQQGANKRRICPLCGMPFKFKTEVNSHLFKTHGYILKGSRLTKPTMRLVYRPGDQTSSSQRGSRKDSPAELWQVVANEPTRTAPIVVPKEPKKRRCIACPSEFLTKAALREHVATNHVEEIISGKIVSKIKVEHLSKALSVSSDAVESIARQIDSARKPGGYIPSHLVRGIVRLIRMRDLSEKRSDVSSSVNSKFDEPTDGPGTDEFKEVEANVLYIPDRETDARRLKSLLESRCASVTLIQVGNDHLTREHAGKIYHLVAGSDSVNLTKSLSRVMRHIERVSPQHYDFQNSLGLTHAIWIANAGTTAEPVANVNSVKAIEGTVQAAVATSSFTLTPAVIEVLLRKDFGDLRQLIDDCLKGRRLRADDQSLFTTDPETLRQYARILKSKLSASSSARRIVTRILEDIAIYEKRGPLLAATKVSWKLLPKGSHPFERILKHFEQLSRRRRNPIFDVARLHKINSLSPDEIYVGIDEFEGYAVFYFHEGPTAVLDCPLTGNAIYVFGENWKTLSRLTKSALINNRTRDCQRIIHKGEWFLRLKSVMATRRVRAKALLR